MIPPSQIKEIRTYLQKAENPLFFFDDDPDGLSSFLLCKKYIDKGKGVSVKSAPILDVGLLHKVQENSPDYIFVLDVPIITQEFIDEVNVPLIWLDHHPPVKRQGVHYYNSLLNKPEDNKPTSYYTYKIVNQNIWLATLGSLADWHIPDFIEEFNANYPGLLPKNLKDPATAIYDSKLGELIKLFSFLLKGKTSEVNRSISILSKIESPIELIDQTTPRAKYLYKKTKKLKQEYENVLYHCLNKKTSGKLLLIRYPKTKTSFLSELSNELVYKKPNKIILVARESKGMVKMSIRSTKTKLSDHLNRALEGLDGYGGGHDHACGGVIKLEHFKEFLERFKNLIK